MRQGDPQGSLDSKVSMESGLEGRNNGGWCEEIHAKHPNVSMESGLEGRNNTRRSR